VPHDPPPVLFIQSPRNAGKPASRVLQFDEERLASNERPPSGLEECQQVGVELVFVSVREAVGRSCVNL